MRRIEKSPQPEALIAWKAANRTNVNFKYSELPSAIKEAVKIALLIEQGWLCAYTGIAISASESHIEHFKPQRLCTNSGEDLDYHNLLAAYPGVKQAGNASLGFGAPFKASEFDPTNLIAPWSDRCERRFQFDTQGKISPTLPQDAAARHTITALGLDHPTLVRLRASAISAFTHRPHSVPELQRLMAGLDRMDSNGHLREFCFVLKQTIVGLLARAEKRRQRRAFARRQPSV